MYNGNAGKTKRRGRPGRTSRGRERGNASRRATPEKMNGKRTGRFWADAACPRRFAPERRAEKPAGAFFLPFFPSIRPSKDS